MDEPSRNMQHNNRRALKKALFISVDTIITLAAFCVTTLLVKSIHTGIFALSFPFVGELLFMWLAAGLLSIPIYIAFGFYRPMWRFASIPQYLTLVFGTLAFTGFVVIASVFSRMTQNVSYYIIFWMVLMISIVFYRLLFRVFVNRRSKHALVQAVPHRTRSLDGQIRVMVVGAGYAGNQIIREMIETGGNRRPIVLIDDDDNKKGLFISKIPVIGGRDKIIPAAREYAIDEIILAIPSASRQVIRDMVKICQQTGCALRIVPLMSDIISGRISISDVREVEIDDLLGRDVIRLDLTDIARYLNGQVVMVTGGGGSIGSELCRQIAKYKPSQLIVFDIYENNAYDLQQELLSQYKSSLNLVVLIGSVRDLDRLDYVLKTYQPSIVFHAAAHKHVPLMQDSPSEAVKNNVIGTYNTALLAGRHNVKRFVLISTDKAVNPTNIMGASKRMAELTVQYINRQFPLTTYMAVRFGNVLGSNGSVIPLFKKQIHQNRCITVTDPNITRYFMTIPEAVSLVIQAGAMAKGGEIFVLDMGEPVKIDDLARDLIRLSGLEPEKDVEIVYTGLRPGEKMYEELCLGLEQMDKTRHEKIFVMKPINDYAAVDKEIDDLLAIIGWDCYALQELVGRIKDDLEARLPKQQKKEIISS